MFGRKDRESLIFAARSSAVESPEFWIPQHLEADAAEITQELAPRLSPLTDRDWVDALDALVPQMSSSRLQVGIPWLRAHVTEFVAQTRYDGKAPARYTTQAVTAIGGRRAMQAEQERLDEARDRAATFAREVSDLIEAVKADPERSWNAYVTRRIIAGAETAIAAREQAEQEEERRLRILECPVCLDSSPGRGVQLRRWPSGRECRSCERCFEVARFDYFIAAADELLSSGSTRREMVQAVTQ